MDNNGSSTPAANDNADPFATAVSALDYLYRLRREMMRVDKPSMDLAERREQQAVLAKFAEAEKLLLAEL
jgi:hypothetical protein